MTENEKINGWTFEETIKTAENLMEAETNMFKWDVLRHLRDFVESSKEELKKYRELGTIEEFQKLKALFGNENLEISETATKILKEYPEYLCIGTIEEFKALKEKSVVKKPIRNDLCTCPSCGTHNEIIKKRRNTVAFDTVYCWHCGQAIEIKRD